jgi:hypothetical protein
MWRKTGKNQVGARAQENEQRREFGYFDDRLHPSSLKVLERA